MKIIQIPFRSVCICALEYSLKKKNTRNSVFKYVFSSIRYTVLKYVSEIFFYNTGHLPVVAQDETLFIFFFFFSPLVRNDGRPFPDIACPEDRARFPLLFCCFSFFIFFFFFFFFDISGRVKRPHASAQALVR